MRLLAVSVQIDSFVVEDQVPEGLRDSSVSGVAEWLSDHPDLVLWMIESGLFRAELRWLGDFEE